MSVNWSPHTGQCSLYGKAHCQNRHQSFVGHWINDGPNNGRFIPLPGYPTIEEVCNACICKHTCCPGIRIVKDQVSNYGGRDEPCNCQKVRYSVYVFVIRFSWSWSWRRSVDGSWRRFWRLICAEMPATSTYTVGKKLVTVISRPELIFGSKHRHLLQESKLLSCS